MPWPLPFSPRDEAQLSHSFLLLAFSIEALHSTNVVGLSLLLLTHRAQALKRCAWFDAWFIEFACGIAELGLFVLFYCPLMSSILLVLAQAIKL